MAGAEAGSHFHQRRGERKRRLSANEAEASDSAATWGYVRTASRPRRGDQRRADVAARARGRNDAGRRHSDVARHGRDRQRDYVRTASRPRRGDQRRADEARARGRHGRGTGGVAAPRPKPVQRPLGGFQFPEPLMPAEKMPRMYVGEVGGGACVCR